ncbi:exodeoxyribonuclease VII large subunit [Uliginosibacterium sp. H3]|uniref:Exodeoxyribonuclease 7 large subunit n=1 Tax=Uliginosibacterium silvisoli TaxID=3114758 RepID=A0ABU6K8B8_9RHOO|nr:exodeoxyribonuclease VII large subunit [Uliginosibacterium sp. H3]
MFSAASGVSTPAIPVSDFVRHLRRHLESGFPLGWVSGEVSNLVRAGSGHIYFTLKDSGGQLRCAMWRNKAQLLPFQLGEGMQVEVRAQVTVYEARGDLQLSVENIRRAGQGNLFEAFMRLKARLEAEGLFASELKRELPHLPQRIGIITSPAAAALRDVLITLRRRAPGLDVILYPTLVQGDAAGEQIAQTILTASARAELDGVQALILCRGGGSMEDLWAFNHEAVARAIRASAIPIVCGVGHETDTTLADFAADVRAATPTAAAEVLSAGWFELRTRLPRLARDLSRSATRRLEQQGQKLDLLERRLVHPRERVAAHRARLDQLALRLQHVSQQQLTARQRQLHSLQTRLERRTPAVLPHQLALDGLQARLHTALTHNHSQRVEKLHALEVSLSHLNPEAVLQRGYAIVRDAAGGVVRDASTLNAGDTLELVLAKGRATTEVRTTTKRA